jgi:hypothetical protein
MNLEQITADQIDAMTAEDQVNLAVNVASRSGEALQKAGDTIIRQEETIRELQASLASVMEQTRRLADHLGESFILIIDDDEPLRISGNLHPTKAKQLLTRALPEIEAILDLPDSRLH